MTATGNLTAQRAAEIVRDAYIYGYPLVLEHFTARQATNVAAPAQPFGPTNQIAHARVLPGPEFRIVIRPNVDTLYSSGFIDLGAEPHVLSVPATDRYFMIPLYDAWTNVFAVPGTRTTGPGTAHEYLLVPPHWTGQVPSGLELLRAPTRLMSLIARTQVNGETDLPAVHAVQDRIRITPLSGYGDPAFTPPPGPVDPSIDMTTPPPVTVAQLEPAAFLRLLADLLVDNPPTACDYPILHQLERIGLRAGLPYTVPDALRDTVIEGVAAGRAAVVEEYDRLNGADRTGWVYTTEGGSYGVNYRLRAGVAAWGLGMNLPDDAIYPSIALDSDGAPLDGANRYVLRFEAGQLPPVHAFWSVTAYDAEGYLIPNPLRRYALGDRSGLVPDPDGSVELLVQATSPGADRETQWLPVQPGPFNLMLRLYSPARSLLTESWTPPPVRRVD
ncbi:DUF1254 domain-containing protein [Nocardia sp. IFM 10818]